MTKRNTILLASTLLLLGTSATFAQTTSATGSSGASVQTMPRGAGAAAGTEGSASTSTSSGIATGTGQNGGNTTATGGTPGGNPTRQ